ncbi:MAG: T9SS type A sorting domain-containing protein [Candidatus Margulisbacteria bacterium]|nr:T9SS type A sorting domain-containing protein [Candidatus Margulisiibacteriota bacterium]MBU1021046.1 T9SS type A sorting domain-containing protein [Candidatus Margulisiibacteriota bacterium]MBU1729721.1 T9SS type A sorting domain-containing protein [Candidatus Margulisiibacteriota bacterium]MBU1955986.1 T9SS type A sorting domain-containing protein [Candidatus Margulisiibacteriota bacterium]
MHKVKKIISTIIFTLLLTVVFAGSASAFFAVEDYTYIDGFTYISNPSPKIVKDSENDLHAIYLFEDGMAKNYIDYTYVDFENRADESSWAAFQHAYVTDADVNIESVDFCIDDDDTLHVAWIEYDTNTSDYAVYYMYKGISDPNWSTPQDITQNPSVRCDDIAIATNGEIVSIAYAHKDTFSTSIIVAQIGIGNHYASQAFDAADNNLSKVSIAMTESGEYAVTYLREDLIFLCYRLEFAHSSSPQTSYELINTGNLFDTEIVADQASDFHVIYLDAAHEAQYLKVDSSGTILDSNAYTNFAVETISAYMTENDILCFAFSSGVLGPNKVIGTFNYDFANGTYSGTGFIGISGYDVNYPDAFVDTDGCSYFVFYDEDNSKVYYADQDYVPATASNLSSPADTSETNNSAVTFEWNAATDNFEIVKYNLSVRNATHGNYSVDVTSGLSESYAVPGDGTYEWDVEAYDPYAETDYLGYPATSSAWSVIVDTVAPDTPNLLSPGTAEVYTTTDDITFSWDTLTDPDLEDGTTRTDVTGTIYIDGDGQATITGIDQTMTESIKSFAALGLGTGNYTWYLEVTDAAGNTAVSETREIIIDEAIYAPDTDAPVSTLTMSQDSDNNWYNDASLTGELAATDLGIGNTNIETYYTISNTTTGSQTSGSFNFSNDGPLTIDFVDEGEYEASYYSIDGEGNMESTNESIVNYDFTALNPITDLALVTYGPTTATVSWTDTYDANTDLADTDYYQVYYSTDGTPDISVDPYVEVNATATSMQTEITGLDIANSTYTIAVVSVDRAGNVSDLSNEVSASAPDIASIEIDEITNAVDPSSDTTLTYTVYDSSENVLDLAALGLESSWLVWTTTGGSVANDVYTAPAEDGNYTLTANSAADETVTDSIEIMVNSGGPSITVTIDGVEVDPTSMTTDTLIDINAEIIFTIADANGVVESSVSVTLDSAPVTSLSISALSAATVDSLEVNPSVSLSDGVHTLVASADDATGENSSTSVSFKVYDSLSVIGTPMNYPNPFNPNGGQSTTIRYTLSQNTNITLMVYDITGKHVLRRVYTSGTTGGSAGQNEITWNGTNDFGTRAGSGVYIYFIVSGGKVLGSGEMAVYNQ